jgi:putative transposase
VSPFAHFSVPVFSLNNILNQPSTPMSTYSQLYIQIVFAVKARQSLIRSDVEERVYKYITGIVKGKGQKLLAINGMPDHVHIFISIGPDCSISDLVREVKKASNAFINENKLASARFQWQEGYGAFSYSHSHIDKVVKYILNQKEHHKTFSFRDEYVDMLKEFKIRYEDKYLFEWI